MLSRSTTKNSDENGPRSYLAVKLWDKLTETLEELARSEAARTKAETDVSIDLNRLNAMDAGEWSFEFSSHPRATLTSFFSQSPPSLSLK